MKESEKVMPTKTAVNSNRLYMMILCAIFAAIIAVATFIQVPLPFTPVPITLTFLAVYLAGGLLGPKYGTISVVVYILIGAIGIPVFSGFRGGIGVLAGATGGYIVGYIAMVLIIGLILGSNRNPSTARLIIATVSGSIACYIFGTAWFMILMKVGLLEALSMCVFPFLLGDLLKLITAVLLIKVLRKRIPI